MVKPGLDDVRFFYLQEPAQFSEGNETEASPFHVQGMNPEAGALQLSPNSVDVRQGDNHVQELRRVQD